PPCAWGLHGAYLLLPAGLAPVAAAAAGAPMPSGLPMHVLPVGTLGVMPLGMMTRVTLGHTGRLLVANKATTLAYALLVAAVVVRAGGPFVGGISWQTVMVVAAILWALAFLIFLIGYTGKLLAPRPDGKPG